MWPLHIFIQICLFSQVLLERLTDDEAKAVSDVIQTLKISFGTLVTNQPESEKTKALKMFSYNRIAVTLMKSQVIADIVRKTGPVSYPAVIILRLWHFDEVFPITHRTIHSQNYKSWEEKMSRLKRDKWTWIMILRPMDPFPDDDVEIPFDVQFIVLEAINGGFNIWEQYHIFVNERSGKKIQCQRKLVGKWVNGVGVESLFEFQYSPRYVFLRRDMKNSTLIIKETRDFQSNVISTFLRFGRSALQLTDAYQTVFGFRKIVRLSGSKYDISARDVTMLGDTTPQTTELWKWAIGPFMKIRLTLYYRQPAVRPLENYALEPFEPELWAVIAGWCIIAVCCILLMAQVENSNSSNPSISFSNRCFNTVFHVIDAFCGQGNGADGDNLSIRIVNFSIWLTVIAVSASYSAIIFTFIMIRKPPVPFTNMDEFVADGTYNYSGTFASLAQDAYNLAAKNSAIDKAHRLHKLPGKYWSLLPRNGINMMCENPKYAFIMCGNQLEEYYWPCSLERMREPYFEIQVGVASRPFTPYVTAFNQKLPLLWSSGVLYVIRNNFNLMTLTRTPPDSPPPDLDLLKHIMLIIPVATACCIAILIYEKITFSMSN